MFFASPIVNIVLGAAALAAAAPAGGPIPIPPEKCPYVETQTVVQGNPWQAGVSVPGGNSMTFGETHTVGITWTEGIHLGIKASNVIDWGLDFSVSETVSQGTSESATEACPPGKWTCSVLIYPSMLQVDGHLVHKLGSCKNKRTVGKDGGHYKILIPRKDPAGNGIFTPKICACKNKEGWADKGAPPPCITEC